MLLPQADTVPPALVISHCTLEPDGKIGSVHGRGGDGDRFALSAGEVIAGMGARKFRLFLRREGLLHPLQILPGVDGLFLVEAGEITVGPGS